MSKRSMIAYPAQREELALYEKMASDFSSNPPMPAQLSIFARKVLTLLSAEALNKLKVMNERSEGETFPLELIDVEDFLRFRILEKSEGQLSLTVFGKAVMREAAQRVGGDDVSQKA